MGKPLQKIKARLISSYLFGANPDTFILSHGSFRWRANSILESALLTGVHTHAVHTTCTMLITFNLRVTVRCSKFSRGRNKLSGILCNNIWFFWVNIAFKSHATYLLCAIAWLLENPNHCFRPLPLLSWKE